MRIDRVPEPAEGAPLEIINRRRRCRPPPRRIRRRLARRAEKAFPVMGRTSVQLIAEVFNAFNWTNYGCLNNFLAPDTNPAVIGLPNCVVSLGRREQVGLRVNF